MSSSSIPNLGKSSTVVLEQCGNCGKLPEKGAAPFSLCGRCKQVRYCSVGCQKGAWKAHKASCNSSDARAAAPQMSGKIAASSAKSAMGVKISSQPSVAQLTGSFSQLSVSSRHLELGRQIIASVNKEFNTIFDEKEYTSILPDWEDPDGFNHLAQMIGPEKALHAIWVAIHRHKSTFVLSHPNELFSDELKQNLTALEKADEPRRGEGSFGSCVSSLCLGKRNFGACHEMASLAFMQAARQGHAMYLSCQSKQKHDNGAHCLVLLFPDETIRRQVADALKTAVRQECSILSPWKDVLSLSKEIVIVDPYLRICCEAGNLNPNFLSYMNIRNIDWVHENSCIAGPDNKIFLDALECFATQVAAYIATDRVQRIPFSRMLLPKQAQFFASFFERITNPLARAFPGYKWAVEASEGIHPYTTVKKDEFDLVAGALEVHGIEVAEGPADEADSLNLFLTTFDPRQLEHLPVFKK